MAPSLAMKKSTLRIAREILRHLDTGLLQRVIGGARSGGSGTDQFTDLCPTAYTMCVNSCSNAVR